MRIVSHAITAGSPGNYEGFLEFELVPTGEDADDILKKAIAENLPKRVHGKMEPGKPYLEHNGNNICIAVRRQ